MKKKSKVPKRKPGAAYDVKKETMLALVVPRTLRARVERKKKDLSLKAFVVEAIEAKLAKAS